MADPRDDAARLTETARVLRAAAAAAINWDEHIEAPGLGGPDTEYAHTVAPSFSLTVADLLDVLAVSPKHLAGLSGCSARTPGRKPNATGECPLCKALAVTDHVLGPRA